MTINSPAAVIFAMFVAQAEKAGVDRARARRHAAERHPEGVPGAEGVRVPAAAVDAAGARHDHVHRGRDAALALDLDLRLPHPRGGLDGRRGAGVHAGQRLRLRRAGAAGRACRSTRSRPGCRFFFNAHIDFFEEIAKYRAARRIWARWMKERYGAAARAVDAAALPHPDRRRVAHRPAARGQHRAHRHRGAGRRARRHAVAAHQLDGRGAGAADREGGPHRAAHPAGASPTRRTSPTSPTRSAARGSSRR